MGAKMIKVGTILEGPYWPQPIEVKKIDKMDDFVHILGVTINSEIWLINC